MNHSMRQATNADMPFIYKAWLQELRTAPSSRFVEDRTFFRQHASLITSIIASDGVRVTLACDPDAPDHLYGYACHASREPLVHWLYVKSTFRGMGLGRALLNAAVWPDVVGEAPIVCSHASGLLGDRTLRARFRVEYNPYVLRGL